VLDVVNCVDPVGHIKTCPGHPDGPDVAIGKGQGLCPLHQLLDDVLAATESRFAETTIEELAYQADGSPTLCVPRLASNASSPAESIPVEAS
jgi:DNA-binding IscR family transcriptional regulator